MDIESKFGRYEDLVEQIKPILADQKPQVQGAVIADLFAIYLANHQGEEVEEVREAIIEHWLKMVHGLVPLYDERVKNFQKKIAKKNKKKLRKK